MAYEKLQSFRIFHPNEEVVEEFLDRFEVQLMVICDETDIEKIPDKKKAALLINCLQHEQTREIQNKAKPKKLMELTFDDVIKSLKEAFDKKKTFTRATVCFVNRKRRNGE